MQATQKSRLKALFQFYRGQWLGLDKILDLRIAQWQTRLKELRGEGMNIINRVEVKDGIRHSYYKYIPTKQERTLFNT